MGTLASCLSMKKYCKTDYEEKENGILIFIVLRIIK